MTCPGPLIWLADLDDPERDGEALECLACGYVTGYVLDPAHCDTPFLREDAP